MFLTLPFCSLLRACKDLGERGEAIQCCQMPFTTASPSRASAPPQAGVLSTTLYHWHCHRWCLSLALSPVWRPMAAVAAHKTKKSNLGKGVAEGSPPHPSTDSWGYRARAFSTLKLNRPGHVLASYTQSRPSKTQTKPINKQVLFQPYFLWTMSVWTQELTTARSPGHFSTAREPSTYPELSVTLDETKASIVKH